MKDKGFNAEIALVKLRKYCDFQDRCHQEVRLKLLNIGVRGETLEKMIGQLIEEGFLDEERFARSFARGKFRHKQWGRQKIQQELSRREIGSYLQSKALQEIDAQEYRQTLFEILMKKKKGLNQYTEPVQKIKLFKHAYQRGFEPDLIYEVISQI